MSQITCTVSFGESKSELATVGYQLYNLNNQAVGDRVTDGVYEIGSGSYGALITFPDDFNGTVRWDSGEADPVQASEAIVINNSTNVTVTIKCVSTVGSILSGVYVKAIIIATNQTVEGITDSNGIVTLTVPSHGYFISAYKNNYVNNNITIVNGIIMITMNKPMVPSSNMLYPTPSARPV